MLCFCRHEYESIKKIVERAIEAKYHKWYQLVLAQMITRRNLMGSEFHLFASYFSSLVWYAWFLFPSSWKVEGGRVFCSFGTLVSVTWELRNGDIFAIALPELQVIVERINVVSSDSSFNKGLSESWHYLFFELHVLPWLNHVFWKILADPVGSWSSCTS